MKQADLVEAITARLHPHRRLIVAIAGPPASGKSTFAEGLALDLGSSAAVVPMDGFHLDNRVLEDRDLLHRKGSAESFDAAGLANLITRLKFEQQVVAPVFDRTLDVAIAGAKVIEPLHRIILVEGNYVLLDQSPWSEMEPLWDMTLSLSTPLPELETRLVNRWIKHGHSPQAARERALANDIPNARLVVSRSRPAEFVIETGNGS